MCFYLSLLVLYVDCSLCSKISIDSLSQSPSSTKTAVFSIFPFSLQNLREGKQSLSFDVSADLIDCRCKLVHLLYSQLKVFGIANLNINLTWRLMSSARHLGNLQMLLSFLNSGTITSSTQAQKCSDELVFILSFIHSKYIYL